MKHINSTLLLILSLCFLGTNNAHAQRRSISKLGAIAKSILNSDADDHLDIICSSADILSAEETGTDESLFYVYAYTDGRPGYTIVSADLETHDVIAYSTTDVFDKDNIPDATRQILIMYAKRAKAGDLATKHVRKAKVMQKAERQSIDPLLGGIAFSQDAPYNGKCPLYNGTPCVTGCTATAMSQVMAYYRHPAKMNADLGNISYHVSASGIDVNWDCANTTFDWNNILDTYKGAGEESMDITATTDKKMFVFTGIVIPDDREGYIRVQNLTNVSGVTINGVTRLVVVDDNGKILCPASEEKVINDIEPRVYFEKYHFYPSLPSALPDGTYRMYIAAKADGDNAWVLSKRADASYRSDESKWTDGSIEVVKTGDKVRILGTDFDCGYSKAQADAVATLCGACGASIEAEYTLRSTAGSMTNAIKSLVEYMDYSKSAEEVRPANFTTDSWHEYLQSELMARRPLLISGFSGNSGHAFVIDGFMYIDDVPYYHVNWGWGGNSNGYYLIDYLKPSEAGTGGYEVNYGETVWVYGGIKPNDGDVKSWRIKADNLAVANTTVNENEEIVVTAERISNATYEPYSGTVYVVAVNSRGETWELGEFLTYVALPFRYGRSSCTFTGKISPSIPTGEYTIELQHSPKGSGERYKVTALGPKVYIKTSTPNGIDNIISQPDANARNIYDINGVKTNATVGKRIYIVDGKKVLR